MTQKNPADCANQVARVVAIVSQSSAPSSKDQRVAAARQLDQLAEQIPAVCLGPLRYHQARYLALGAQLTDAKRALDEAIRVGPSPEAIWLQIQWLASDPAGDQKEQRWKREDQLAELLPMSQWGFLRDARLESREAGRLDLPMSDGPRVTIPLVDAEKLTSIAKLYKSMEMAGEAARSYREALYAGLGPPGFPQSGPDTWLSAESAETWMTIADCDTQAGEDASAVQALLMAVASSPNQRPAADLLVRRLFDDHVDRPASGKRLPDAAKFIEIAQLYRACHLHPRAIRALDEAAKLPGQDVSKLRDEIEAEWADLIVRYARGRELICFLFGRQIAKTPNRLDLLPD